MAGGILLRMRLLFVTLATILLTPAVVSAAETSIFYYPWWGTLKRDGSYLHWSQRGHVPPDDLATTFYPARGVYSSSDWKLVRSQMKEIARSGVSEIVSSWWGRGSIEDRRLPVVMHAAWASHLDVAVQIEPYEKTRRTASVLGDELAYLHSLGVRRVYVYRPFDDLIDDASWRDLTAQYPDLEMWAQTSDPERAAAAGFEGVYTYDVFGVRGGAFASLCARAHAVGLACSPSVGPGYNARRGTGDERVRSRRNGATYDGMWRAAIAAAPDRITITSYNEWHEGTQIEPAAKHARTFDGRYANYDGAYGKVGVAAQTAYLARTEHWTGQYRAAAAARGAIRAVIGFLSL